MRGVDWKNGCGFMGVRLVLFGFLASSVPSCEPKIALLFCERILLWRPSSACCRPQGCDDDFYCSTMTLLTWAQLDYLLGRKLVTGRCQYSDGIYFLVFKARLEIWMNRRKLWIFFLHDKKIVSTWMYNILEAVYRSDFRFDFAIVCTI